MTNERAVEILNLDLDILGQYGDETAEAYKMAIKALDAQPSEDCISREEAINEADNLSLETSYDNEKVEQMLRDLPSVTPKYTDEEIDKAQAVEQAYVDKMVELAAEEAKRPKGKWIKCKSRFEVTYFKCSECGRKLNWIDRDDNYCNNCGSNNSESTKEWFKEWNTKLAEMSGGGDDEET